MNEAAVNAGHLVVRVDNHHPPIVLALDAQVPTAAEVAKADGVLVRDIASIDMRAADEVLGDSNGGECKGWVGPLHQLQAQRKEGAERLRLRRVIRVAAAAVVQDEVSL